MSRREGLYRIEAPFFVAGLVIDKGVVIIAAPIIWWMRAWPAEKAIAYAEQRDWKMEKVKESWQGSDSVQW